METTAKYLFQFQFPFHLCFALGMFKLIFFTDEECMIACFNLIFLQHTRGKWYINKIYFCTTHTKEKKPGWRSIPQEQSILNLNGIIADSVLIESDHECNILRVPLDWLERYSNPKQKYWSHWSRRTRNRLMSCVNFIIL